MWKRRYVWQMHNILSSTIIWWWGSIVPSGLGRGHDESGSTRRFWPNILFLQICNCIKKKKKPALKNVRYIFYRWCIFTHTQTAHKSWLEVIIFKLESVYNRVCELNFTNILLCISWLVFPHKHFVARDVVIYVLFYLFIDKLQFLLTTTGRTIIWLASLHVCFCEIEW